MKFFVISGYIYPVPVEDANDGCILLDEESSMTVVDAWSRGVVVSESGGATDGVDEVAAVVQAWSTAIAEHPYFNRKNADATERAHSDKAGLMKKLANMKLPKVKLHALTEVVDAVS